jgi:hypothetical protein
VRPEGQMGSRPGRLPAWHGRRRGHARRPPGGGQAPTDAHQGRDRRGAACELRALRLARRVERGGDGADARRGVHTPLPASWGAGRPGSGDEGTIDVEVVGVAHVRRAHARGTRRVDVAPARRRAPGRPDARRDRAEGPHERRGARDHDGGREDPARAVGGLQREQDGRDRPALRPHRPRRGCRAGRARGDRRRQGAQGRRPRGARRPHPGPQVRSSQGEERRRAPARARPSRRQAAAAARVRTRRSPARPGRASGTRRGAGALASRRRRIAPRGPRGDAHRHPPRRQGCAQAHARTPASR